jgi:hypothetical protein
MSAPSECLAAGFRLATRRVHLVLLDSAAKLLWLAASAVFLALAMNWALSRIIVGAEAMAAFESGIPILAFGAMLGLLVAHQRLLAGSLFAAFVLSALLWIVMEAFIRSGILPVTRGRSFLRDAVTHFPCYLITGAVRRLVLLSASVLVGLVSLGPLLTSPIGQWSEAWPELRLPVLAGAGILVLLAIFLLIIDTIVRSDAWNAVAEDLPKVISVIGALAFFELALIAAVPIILTVVFDVAGPGRPILLGTGITVAGLSVVHSYLLLVRYSAVGIMRHEAEDKLAHR